jgi:hypothetical protein
MAAYVKHRQIKLKVGKPWSVPRFMSFVVNIGARNGTVIVSETLHVLATINIKMSGNGFVSVVVNDSMTMFTKPCP